MKIAMTSLYLPSSSKIGVGWMAHRLANALTVAGQDVTMFSPAAKTGDALYEHRQLEQRGRLRSFRWGLAMRHIDLSGFDALLAQGDDHFVRRHAVPVHIRTMHGSCFDEARHQSSFRGRVRMIALGLTEVVSAVRTPIVVGVSKNSIRFYPWLNRVIPNGVDTSVFGVCDGNRPKQEKEAVPTILFVGTYDSRKRGRLLVETFTNYVRPRVPDAQLWMVCTDAPESPGVSVLGRIDDADLADRYRRAWVFCLPSTYEGFGVPYIEALLSGTAVVATWNQGSREVLEGGRLGRLASDEDLGRALVELLVDDDVRATLEKDGPSQRERYDFATVAKSYVTLIESEVASHG